MPKTYGAVIAAIAGKPCVDAEVAARCDVCLTIQTLDTARQEVTETDREYWCREGCDCLLAAVRPARPPRPTAYRLVSGGQGTMIRASHPIDSWPPTTWLDPESR